MATTSRSFGAGGIKVLICDDNADDRLFIRRALESDERVTVLDEADSAASVVNRAALLQPDAIVIDMRMPGMTGAEAIPQLRQRCPNSRIVAVSGIEDSMLLSALEHGADARVLKQTGMKEVLNAVVGLFDRPG